MTTRSIALRGWRIGLEKMKIWAILRIIVVILEYFCENEYTKGVHTTKMESNTLSCHAVSDKKK